MTSRSFCLLFALPAVLALAIDESRFDTDSEKWLFATVMIAFGLFLAFFGARHFKGTVFTLVSLGCFFTAFHFLQSEISDDTKLYGACAGIAVVGGGIAMMSISLALVLIGLFGGAVFAYGAYVSCLHYISNDPKHYLLYSIVTAAALIGCYIGFKATRVIIIVITSAVGVFSVVSAIDLVTDQQLSPDNLRYENLNDLGWSLVVGWVVLTLVGIVFQSGQKSHPSLQKWSKGEKNPLIEPTALDSRSDSRVVYL